MEIATNSNFLVLQVIHIIFFIIIIILLFIILIWPNLGLNLVHCTSYHSY